MKKVISLFAGFVFMSAVVFGAPKAIRFPSTIGNDVPESELVKVTFKSSIVVVAIDGVENKDESLSKLLNLKSESEEYLDSYFSTYKKDRTVLLQPGTHIFAVKFNNGKAYTTSANSLKFNFDAGSSYKIVSKIEGNKVTFDVLDSNGKSLTNPNNYNLHQKSILTYVERVLDSVSAGKAVTLRTNSGIYWNYGPDITVHVIENYTEEHDGFIGFITDKDLKKGTIYIKFNDDNSLTKDEFLNLKPENCDRVYEIDEIANSAGLCFKLKNPKSSKDDLLMSVY